MLEKAELGRKSAFDGRCVGLFAGAGPRQAKFVDRKFAEAVTAPREYHLRAVEGAVADRGVRGVLSPVADGAGARREDEQQQKQQRWQHQASPKEWRRALDRLRSYSATISSAVCSLRSGRGEVAHRGSQVRRLRPVNAGCRARSTHGVVEPEKARTRGSAPLRLRRRIWQGRHGRAGVETYRNARPSTRRAGRMPHARRVRRRIGSTAATRAESETAAAQRLVGYRLNFVQLESMAMTWRTN